MKPLLGCLVAALYVAACLLPGEPSGAERIRFEFNLPDPLRLPLAGDVEPVINVFAGTQPVQNPAYHLETLDPSVVRVDSTGRGLVGAARGAASVRVVYPTAIGSADTVFHVQVVVARVAVDSPALAFARLGATHRLRAAAFDSKDAAVPNVPFTWSSSNSRVATVNDTGLVTAMDEGAAVIRVVADSVVGVSSVLVAQGASQVRVAPAIDTVHTVGRSALFIAVAFDDSGHVLRTAKAHWNSTDTTVARVDTTGVATATGGGTTRIVARVGTATDTATLVVKQVVRFLLVFPGFDTLTAIQDTRRVTPIASDSLGNPIPSAPVAWATGDATIATVDQTGLVTAAANGVTLVTATSGGQSAFATVVVHQQVASVRLSQDNVALTGAGDTVRLSAAGLDRNGYPVAGTALPSGALFTWRTAFRFVATVDSSGLVTAHGNGTTNITVTVTSGGQSATATVTVTGAPSSDAIAFASYRGIEAVLIDGSQRSVLIPSSAGYVYSQPSWAPDGARLAFIRNYCDVVTAGTDGSNLRPLDIGNGSTCDASPAWSPDGTKIAFSQGGCRGFSSSSSCYTAIYVKNADGSNLLQLTKAGGESNPTWSPDGTKLAFRDNSNTISVVNSDGTGLHNLTTSCCQDQPAWSPDGSQIAFGQGGDIWLMNAGGSGAHDLTGGQISGASKPAWSGDGSRLVFAAPGSGGSDLYIIGRDGTGLQRVTATGDAQDPAWRPAAAAPSAGRLLLPRARPTPRPRPRPKP